MAGDDFHDRLIAALDAVYPPTEPRDQEHDMTSPTQRRHDELVALLAEIRDRLPERTEVKAAPFDPDLVARNLDACKHEAETPMREHGECCEPAPADVDPDEALARAMYDAGDDRHVYSWQSVSGEYLDMARAAREHIKGEPPRTGEWDAMIERAEKAQDRATKAEVERDEWREVAARYADGRDKWQAKWRESDEARERAEAALADERDRHEALAGFEREDVAPFHGHGHSEPGYWRLVGPKHYQPLPPLPTDAVDELRRRLKGDVP